MGEGIAGLIAHELHTVVDEAIGEGVAVFAGRAEEQLAGRESNTSVRARELAATEERLRGWTEVLRSWEGEFEALERQSQLASKLAPRPIQPSRKVGRNERCPCGSGLKCKHCHRLAGRR